MSKVVQLDTMRAVAQQIDSYSKFKGNRAKSKTDGLILIDFLRRVFEHNHITQRERRLQDHEIRELVASEFTNDSYRDAKRNYVAVWRNMFNTGRLHVTTTAKRNFVAFRVNEKHQFTRSTSQKVPLSLDQLEKEYKDRDLIPRKELRNEVKGYAKED